MGRGLTSAPRSFRSLDVSDGGHAVTVTEALLWSWSSVLHEPRACSRLGGVCSSSPRLPRSARVRCVRPARSAPTSSTRCPSPRPSGQPLGSGRCEPPPSLGAGLDSAPEGVRSLGGAPVAERLLGLLFRTGARPGQRPGIPGPRHGSRSVSEHGPLTDRVARDRPSGPGCRVHSGASGGDASPRPRGQSQAAGGAGPTPGEARTGGRGSRALCPGRGHPSPGPSSAAGSGPVWLVTSGSAVPGRP